MKVIGVKPGDGLAISAAPEGGGPVQIYNSYVEQAGEDALLVTVPVSKGRLVKLPLNAECGFDFYARDGLYRTRGTILEYLHCNEVCFMKIQVGDYEYIQRRDLYRVDADFDMKFTRPTSKGVRSPAYRGTCKDISGGGMQLISSADLMESEVVSFRLPLRDKLVTVKGQVLNVRPVGKGSGRPAYIYRIKFVSLTMGVQDKIIQYVFDRQREFILRQGGRGRGR